MKKSRRESKQRDIRRGPTRKRKGLRIKKNKREEGDQKHEASCALCALCWFWQYRVRPTVGERAGCKKKKTDEWGQHLWFQRLNGKKNQFAGKGTGGNNTLPGTQLEGDLREALGGQMEKEFKKGCRGSKVSGKQDRIAPNTGGRKKTGKRKGRKKKQLFAGGGDSSELTWAVKVREALPQAKPKSHGRFCGCWCSGTLKVHRE